MQLYMASCAQPAHKTDISTNKLNQIAKGVDHQPRSEYTSNLPEYFSQIENGAAVSLPDVYAADHRVSVYALSEPQELPGRFVNMQLFQQRR